MRLAPLLALLVQLQGSPIEGDPVRLAFEPSAPSRGDRIQALYQPFPALEGGR